MELCVGSAVRRDDDVEVALAARFVEQRNRDDRETMNGGIQARQPLGRFFADAWLDDRFEVAAGVRVGEDQVGECAAIERAVRVEKRPAKPLRDLRQRVRPGPDDVAGDRVGVEGRDASLFEHIQYVTLAGGNPAGERYSSNTVLHSP